MNVAPRTAAALLQALMGPADTAAPADPAAPVAGGDFAMMMAGAATPPVAPAEDAAASDDVTKAAAKDQDESDSGTDEAPDAVLLAMMAITPPPAPAEAPAGGGADVQAPATISAAALATAHAAAMPPGTAAHPDPATTPQADTIPKTMPTVDDAAPSPIAVVSQDPADPKRMPPTLTDATQQPASATAVIRKAIAGLLGFKPAAPANAPEVIAAAAAAPQEASGSRHSHPVAAATTDDDHADADAPAIAVVPAGGTIAAIAPGAAATRLGDTGAAVAQHPAADVSAQLGEHHIALAQGDGWLDQLARDISSTAAPDGKLHFRLNPQRLGSLQVEVARGADGAAVRLTADSRATRDILIDAQPQLAAQAQAQGVRIAGTHVDLGTGTNGGQGGGGQGGGGQQPNRAVPQARALGVAAVSIVTEPAGPRSAASERYA